MTTELRESLLHHLRRESRPLDRQHLCKELERFGVVSDAVPSVPAWEWSDALDSLITEGLVSAAGGRVAINRDVIPKQENNSQGMLF